LALVDFVRHFSRQQVSSDLCQLSSRAGGKTDFSERIHAAVGPGIGDGSVSADRKSGRMLVLRNAPDYGYRPGGIAGRKDVHIYARPSAGSRQVEIEQQRPGEFFVLDRQRAGEESGMMEKKKNHGIHGSRGKRTEWLLS